MCGFCRICGAVIFGWRRLSTGRRRFRRDAPDALNPIPSLFEYDMTENELRTALAVNPIQAVDGELPVPDAPGLGIEIDRDVLEKYAVL